MLWGRPNKKQLSLHRQCEHVTSFFLYKNNISCCIFHLDKQKTKSEKHLFGQFCETQYVEVIFWTVLFSFMAFTILFTIKSDFPATHFQFVETVDIGVHWKISKHNSNINWNFLWSATWRANYSCGKLRVGRLKSQSVDLANVKMWVTCWTVRRIKIFRTSTMIEERWKEFLQFYPY